MASEGPTTPRRRPLRTPRRRPLRALVPAAALLAICGLAYGALRTGDPEVAPAEAGPPEGIERREPPPPARPPEVTRRVSPAAASEGAAAAVRRAYTELTRRPNAITVHEVSESLAAARRGGRAPIAVVTARTGLRRAPGGPVIERLGTATEFGSPRVHAVVGRDRQWLEVMAAELPNDRTGWVSARDVDVEGVEYSLRASLHERTLEVRRRGRVVRRVAVAVGGPATPTPTGTFAVTDKLRMTEEGSAYGCCALAFSGHQPAVPQGWSGGDRLAVHGTPHEATVGDAASLGCFRAREADMRWLVNRVPLGTRVTVVR